MRKDKGGQVNDCGPNEMNRHEATQSMEDLLIPKLASLRKNLAAMLYRSTNKPPTDDEIDSLLNQAVAEALPKFESFDHSRSIVAWLTRFGATCLLRAPRQRMREAWVEFPSELEDLFESTRQKRAEDRERIEALLCKMPAEFAQLIRLWHLEDATMEQMKEVTGAPTENAVRSRLTRAMSLLKEIGQRCEKESE